VPTYVEAGTGKVFPQSERAADVVAALVRRLSGAARRSRWAEPAVDVRPTAIRFLVITSRANHWPARNS